MTNGKTFWIVLFGSLALFFASGSLFAGLFAFIGGLAFICWKEVGPAINHAMDPLKKDWREEVAASRARGDDPG